MELWRTLNFSRPSGTLSSMCAEGEVVWGVTVVAAGKLRAETPGQGSERWSGRGTGQVYPELGLCAASGRG